MLYFSFLFQIVFDFTIDEKLAPVYLPSLRGAIGSIKSMAWLLDPRSNRNRNVTIQLAYLEVNVDGYTDCNRALSSHHPYRRIPIFESYYAVVQSWLFVPFSVDTSRVES